MTIDEIRTKVREITNTSTTDYSDASLIRDLNSETIALHTHILAVRGPMEFDDPNNTGYTSEDLAIVAGTDTYDIQTDEHSDQIYTVHKVVFNKLDIPRLQFTEGNNGGSVRGGNRSGFAGSHWGGNQEHVLDRTDEADTPIGYYDFGKAIQFTQIPKTSGTATIYYDRAHHYIVTGDTSLELGLPRSYHQLACYRVAYNYAVDKGLSNLETVRRRMQEEESRLEWYEENRRGDEQVLMSVQTPRGL